MNFLNRMLAVAGLAAVLAGCATQGQPAMGNLPDTRTTVLPKDTIGAMFASRMQTVYMQEQTNCKWHETGPCTEQDDQNCQRALNAWAIPVSVHTASGTVRGLVTFGAAAATTSAGIGLPGQIITNNVAVNGGFGIFTGADNGTTMGVQDRLSFHQKCAGVKASLHGSAVIDVRLIASGPGTIQLEGDGSVIPTTSYGRQTTELTGARQIAQDCLPLADNNLNDYYACLAGHSGGKITKPPAVREQGGHQRDHRFGS
jgi:hypothetical protein